LLIHDETTSGQKTNSFTLDCLTERMTVRELLRARIYQEVPFCCPTMRRSKTRAS